VTNNDGSIETTVYANAAAGFSMIRFTGTSSAGTLGHGLPNAPKFIISQKPEESDCRSAVYHAATGASQYLFLNYNNSVATQTEFWGGVEPTDTVYSVGSSASSHTNMPNAQMVHYAWCEIPGYSFFGSYTGNGAADGPFVFCGFRPRWIMTKAYTTTSEWVIWDTARDPYNLAEQSLQAQSASNELTHYDIDVLSNGFKIRTSFSTHNQSGYNYLVAAFAEHPFGGDGVSPATAR
jgi:hypothetical protein